MESMMNMSVMAPPSAEPKDFLEAFQRLQAEVRAVPDNELGTVNVDVPSAVATVLGALPEIMALRGDIAAINGVDLTKLDKLRDYALALGHAHGAYRAALSPSDPVTKLAEEVVDARDQLLADAQGLARRGLLESGSIEKLRTPSGYKNIAFDLVSLVQIFRERSVELADKTPVTEQELKRAAELAQRLITAIGLKEQATSNVSAATTLRLQAFTLFANAYDEVRRAVSFLRWHSEDVDSIAPSLWAGRRGRKAGPEPEPVAAPVVATLVSAPSTPVAGATAAAPAKVGIGGPFMQ